jgi:aspartate/methionine/tyrosine aminotransferase
MNMKKSIPKISERAGQIKPFLAMDILERAGEMENAGIDVVHLEVGEPDFPVPPSVKAVTLDALHEDYTCYTHSLGDLRLREAICRHYASRYGVSVSPERVMVTAGTSPAMLLVFAAILDPGDEVILSDPHYACYPNFVRFSGGRPVMVPVYENDGFQLSAAAIKPYLTPQTRAVIINSPANPTGTVLSGQRLREIAELPANIISDEVYHGLVYEGEEHSILEYTDEAFVLNGFSKAYAMTGLRLGYVIMPETFVRTIQVLHQNFMISANSLAQRAGIAALEHAAGDVARMRETYDQRRRYMIKRLGEMGFHLTVEPTGAFYVFVNAAHIDRDSLRLAFDILEKARVGVTPGIDFGDNGEGYLRFSYANSIENIAAGLDRLKGYLEQRNG